MGGFADRVGMGFGGGLAAVMGAVAETIEESRAKSARQSGGGGNTVTIPLDRFERLLDAENANEINKSTIKDYEKTVETAKRGLQNYAESLKNFKEALEEERAARRADQETIQKYESTLAEMRQAIANLEQGISKRNQAIANRDKAIEERDKAITERDKYIEDQNAFIEKLKTKNKELVEANQKLFTDARKNIEEVIEKGKEQVAKLNQQIEALTNESGTLIAERRKLLQERDRLLQERGEAARKLGEAEQKARDLERALANMETSFKALSAENKSLKASGASAEELRQWHAANLALRCALEVQLLRADPDNPLIVDQELRDRVRRAGEMAVVMLEGAQDLGANAPDPFDMAREAGLTFSVPGRPSSVQVLEEIALTDVYIKRLQDIKAGDDTAIRALLQIQRGTGPVSAARELLEAMEPDSPLLKPVVVQRVRSIAAEEFQKQQQERRLRRAGNGASARWSAAMLGQQQVHIRVVEEIVKNVDKLSADEGCSA